MFTTTPLVIKHRHEILDLAIKSSADLTRGDIEALLHVIATIPTVSSVIGFLSHMPQTRLIECRRVSSFILEDFADYLPLDRPMTLRITHSDGAQLETYGVLRAITQPALVDVARAIQRNRERACARQTPSITPSAI